jgi:hypothetical protein
MLLVRQYRRYGGQRTHLISNLVQTQRNKIIGKVMEKYKYALMTFVGSVCTLINNKYRKVAKKTFIRTE